jgi:monoamine oxidase
MDQIQEHTQIHVGVVVVGAGLSGIQAAHRIQEAGISCVVVEATNRVGGKTFSVKSRSSGLGKNDLGGAWINVLLSKRFISSSSDLT